MNSYLSRLCYLLALVSLCPCGLVGYGMPTQDYSVEGKFALAVEHQGQRQLSGHFDQVRGELTQPAATISPYGKGRVVMRLDSWQPREAGQPNPLEALTGHAPAVYGVLDVDVLQGLAEAQERPGVPVRGRLLGYLSLGDSKQRIDAPVHVIALADNRVVVQAIGTVPLSCQQLGLVEEGARKGEASRFFDDRLKGYFRLVLAQAR